MSDLVKYDENDQPTTTTIAFDPTGGRLVAWAEGLAAAHRIGTALCQTTFAPQHFRGKPDDAAAAILYGDELGLTPTQSLRSIFVVSGTPSLYARQMVALVMSKGHEVWVTEKSDARVTVAGKRRGTNHIHEETWTLDRARKAGYTNNKKYQTDPQAMLYARAAADVCRTIAPDALAGLAYTVEELEISDSPTTTVQRTTTERKTTAQRKKAEPAPAAPEPELDEPAPAPTPEPVNEEAGITDAQLRKLHAAFNEAGISDRGERLAYAAAVVGRDLASSKGLTKTEAGAVIDRLESDHDVTGAGK